ncbi:non-specific serine/threonine protein kinase, polo kinase [Trachipleistophora hominis]|uniref:non-specific serine/threonine protein kinase n=1 Tax=Trachipleistophora hominis TaxID=72359 RepID=L7JZU5_TRAHO|nr:non-specific serine/threonine protein kinase, polo kinase [Trachipleistophora hominis]
MIKNRNVRSKKTAFYLRRRTCLLARSLLRAVFYVFIVCGCSVLVQIKLSYYFNHYFSSPLSACSNCPCLRFSSQRLFKLSMSSVLPSALVQIVHVFNSPLSACSNCSCLQFSSQRLFDSPSRLYFPFRKNKNLKICTVMELVYHVGQYKTVRVLGEGRYATVYEGINCATNQRVAIKITCKMLMAGTNPHFISNERRTYEILKNNARYSPNIVQFVDFKEDRENAFFIMEYFDGFTLQRVVYESLNNKEREKLTDSERKGFLMQIGDALQFLHALDIFHGDLKPENIIVRRQLIKLCDFGCSIVSSDRMCAAKRLVYNGTPGYAPPEVLDMGGMVNLEDLDTWAYACVIYYLYSGVQPFAKDNLCRTFQNLKMLEVGYDGLPGYVRAVCERVFRKQVSERIRMDGVMEMVKMFPV